jgi:hypothetical protein
LRDNERVVWYWGRAENSFFSWKTINITYFCVCVCVCACLCESWCVGVCALAPVCALAHLALLIQYAKRRRHVLCVVFLHNIFRHYLINGMIFGRTSLNIKRVFWFFLQRLFVTFLIIRKIRRDIVINV